jgi:antitoxin component YwqK of YwqJK toxin-antitoxin module
MTDRLSYVYDNKGNGIEEKHQMLLLLNGKSSVTHELVEKGEYKDGLIHKKEAYQDGKKIAEHRMTYNAAGKIDEQTTFDGGGNFRFRIAFHYNEQGDAYKWIGYSESGKVRAEGGNRFEYDSRGNVIKKQSCQNGELISEEIREMEYY